MSKKKIWGVLRRVDGNANSTPFQLESNSYTLGRSGGIQI